MGDESSQGWRKSGGGNPAGGRPHRFFAALPLLALLLLGTLAQAAAEKPRTIRVVMDDDFPPYVFSTGSGKLQGILIDQWQAWERKTGIKAEIRTMDWREAMRRMRAGEFDVIDTVFDVPERRTYFDFGPPYAQIEVTIFFRSDISGIADLKSLRGFPVAAQTGNFVADMLKANGLTTVLLFPNFEAVAGAAKEHKVNVFVADASPAIYYLTRLGIADEFRRSAPIFIDEFHRAVRKGDTAMLRTVTQGFAAITPGELKQIDEKWFGRTLYGGRYLVYAGYAAAAALLLILGLGGWNRALSRRVARRTAALRQSENRFRTLIEKSDDVIVLLAPDGTALYESPAVARVLGYETAELVGKNAFEFVHPEDRAGAIKVFAQLCAAARKSVPLVLRYRHKDGSYLLLEGTGTNLLDEPGVDSVVLSYRDVTENRRAEEALRESEKRFKTLFEQAAVGVAQADAATGRFVNVNQRYCEIVGRSRQELEKLTFSSVTHPDDVAGDMEMIRQLKAGAIREFTREKRYLRKDGSVVWANPTVSAMWAPGETPDYTIAVVQDITERKRLEEQFRQSQKMEAIGTLAGGIAHDFNNILASISGYAELAEMKLTGNPEVREYLASVLVASGRATDLVRQILTFSRRQPLERRPIPLLPIVAETLKLLRATIPSTIEFDTPLATDAPAVFADATQIHQILMNLATNAWHAMNERPGRLQVKLEKCVVDAAHAAAQPRLRPGVYARVSVSDTGRGMDQATLRRIFEPFFTTKPPGEGTGLGLAVVQGIMDNHDGAVTVYSRPGEGTVFHLYFPAHNGAAIEAVAEQGEVPRGRGERILFVDDEEFLAQLGHKILSSMGYDVEVATQPATALALVQADPQRFALVITDQTMPGMTGLALAGELRQACPGLPVILMTGYSLSLTTERLEAAGIHHLLLKPTTIHTLATAAHAALSARAPR